MSSAGQHLDLACGLLCHAQDQFEAGLLSALHLHSDETL